MVPCTCGPDMPAGQFGVGCPHHETLYSDTTRRLSKDFEPVAFERGMSFRLTYSGPVTIWQRLT